MPWRAGIGGALIAALITLPGLGVGTLWDNSETAYGEIAREVLLRGDFVVMHLNGTPWFVQPPLYFWIAALFAHWLGAGALALRLPAALATIAMGAVIAYAVGRQIGERAGIYASLILSTSLMQAVVGRLAIMDALLDLAVAFAIFCWFRALQSGSDAYTVLGWIAIAFGFLAKGPVAPVLALLVIVPFALWNRRVEATRFPGWRGWFFGLGAFLLIVAPWFVALTLRTGVPAVAQLIGHYSIGRYTGVIENQPGPIWYYLPVIILGFFPWIAFLPAAVGDGITRLRAASGEGADRLLRLGLIWAVLPFLFFSLARTKLPNYVALEFPALALIVAVYFDAVARSGFKRSAVAGAVAVPATVGLLAIAVVVFVRSNRLNVDLSVISPQLIVIAAVLFVGSIVSTILLVRRAWMQYAPYVLGAATIVAVDVIAMFVLPTAERYKPIPQLAAIIQRERQPNDAVAIENVAGGNALIFYTQPGVYALATPGTRPIPGAVEARGVICGAPRAWVIAPVNPVPNDTTFGRDRQLVARSGKAALFLYFGRGCTALRQAQDTA